MENHKFKFQKLELPKQVSQANEHLSNSKKIDRRLFMDPHTSKKNTTSKEKYTLRGLFILIAAICIGLIYYIYVVNNTLNTILKKTDANPKAIKFIKKIIIPQKTTKKPIYFNYYDSIVFLNDVRGTKIVVSKGFDEYIKKDKIIVKSDGYYYNVFCKDLYSNYAVGDSIP